jgi:hypothetical protein
MGVAGPESKESDFAEGKVFALAGPCPKSANIETPPGWQASLGVANPLASDVPGFH